MKKENITLLVALAIPVLMVIFIVAAIFIPRQFIKPAYSFIYALGPYPSYAEDIGPSPNSAVKERICDVHYFSVEGETLTEKTTREERFDCTYREGFEVPKFYIYDNESGQSRELNREELKSLKLDSNLKSADGFRVEHYYSNENISTALFGGTTSDRDSVYMKGEVVSKKLDIQWDGRQVFNFVAWVKK